MSETNERSVASAGSVEPVAWAVDWGDGYIDAEWVYSEKAKAECVSHSGADAKVVPLYRWPALTPEEREPVAWLVEGCEYDTGCEFQYVALLREQADAAAAKGARLTPLYRQTPPVAWQLVHECERLRDEVERMRFTASERASLECMAIRFQEEQWSNWEKVVRGLLKRLGGEQ